MWESMRFYQVAHYITFFSFSLQPHLKLTFMSNYSVMANKCFGWIQLDLKIHGE